MYLHQKAIKRHAFVSKGMMTIKQSSGTSVWMPFSMQWPFFARWSQLRCWLRIRVSFFQSLETVSRWRCSFKNPPTYPGASRCGHDQSGFSFLEKQNCFLSLLGLSNMLQLYKKLLFSIPKELDVVKSGHVPWSFHFTLKELVFCNYVYQYFLWWCFVVYYGLFACRR